MTNSIFDVTKLHRSSVGFDQLFNQLQHQFTNSTSTSGNFPPYDVVEIDDNRWAVSLAVAGFQMEELDITQEKNQLTITGSVSMLSDEEAKTYLHKGIATRNFTRSFTLADFVEVAEARLVLGVLTVYLTRVVPEAEQPKKITIK